MSVFVQVRSNGQITLPTATRRQVGLKEGDLVEVIVEEDGSIRLIAKVAVDRSQAYFWSKRWQEGERQAEADVQAGRYRDFDTMEDLLADLER